MRKAVVILTLYLALGLVTSVAVAWLCAVAYLASDGYTREYLVFGQLDRSGRLLEANSLTPPSGGDLKWWSGDDGWGPFPKWSVLNDPPDVGGRYVTEFAAGWPTLCLYSSIQQETHEQHPFEWERTGRVEGRINLPWPNWEWFDADHLPTRPIWLNLIVNVVFWTAVWLVVMSLRNLWRYNKSLRRVPKGKCGWCAYDLRKTPRDAKCPECGHAVTKPPRLFALPSWVGAVVMMFALLLVTSSIAVFFVINAPVKKWHRSAYHGDVETVSRALARGADPNEVIQFDRGFMTAPLILALQNGQSEVARLLLDAGADPGVAINTLTPLVVAVLTGDHKLMQRLIDVGADPEAGYFGFTPFVAAVQAGDRQAIQILLDTGAMTDGALHTAVRLDDLDLVRLFLDAGADPNYSSSNTPLHEAASVEMIDLLVDAGANVSAGVGSWSPLTRAVSSGRPDLVHRLLEHGAPIDAAALRSATQAQHLDVLKMLIDAGGDVTTLDQRGLSIWHWVDVQPMAAETWALLYEQYPDVNARGPGQRTPLHMLVNEGLFPAEFVLFLLDHGADPRIQDANGRTAIDDAFSDHLSQLLIEAAAKLDRKETAQADG